MKCTSKTRKDDLMQRSNRTRGGDVDFVFFLFFVSSTCVSWEAIALPVNPYSSFSLVQYSLPPICHICAMTRLFTFSHPLMIFALPVRSACRYISIFLYIDVQVCSYAVVGEDRTISLGIASSPPPPLLPFGLIYSRDGERCARMQIEFHRRAKKINILS